MIISTFGEGIVKRLTRGNGDRSTIFSFNNNGLSVLHIAASCGHLEICKYLVEELKGDVNAPGYGAGAEGLHLSLSSCLKPVASMSMFASMHNIFDCVDDVLVMLSQV